MRITPQRLLNQERQAIKSPAHVGVAGRKPNSRSARHRDHRRRLPFASAFISAVTVGASTVPVIRIRPPVAINFFILTPFKGRERGSYILRRDQDKWSPTSLGVNC